MPRRPLIRRVPWAAYLWPGLPHLWNAGSWAGLSLAAGFSVLLNVLILSVFVWPEWLPERVRLACGVTTLVLWVVALVETRNELRRQQLRRESDLRADGDTAEANPLETNAEENPADRIDTGPPRRSASEEQRPALEHLFRHAQHAYLAADWVLAEQHLRRLLRSDRDDIEGLLLLASVWRRCGRVKRARRLVARLARREDAQPWREELIRELETLENVLARDAKPTAQANETTDYETTEADADSPASIPLHPPDDQQRQAA